MAWFEGLTNLKGQLTNLAKGVLTDENQDAGDDLNTINSNIEDIKRTNTSKDSTEWNDAATFSADNFVDPATVTLSSWSNEELQHQITDEEKHATKKEKDNSADGDDEATSIIPRRLASFFAHHISTTHPTGVEKIEIGVQTEGELQLQIQTLTDLNSRLLDQNASLTSDVASLSRVIEDLESQVAVSQDENANLSTGLEELDIQHQQAIEQVLVNKDETQKLLEVLQAKYNELEYNFEKELNQRIEANTRSMKDAYTTFDTEFRDVGTEVEQPSVDIIRELEERDNELELVVCENARLREVLKDLKEELERQSESLPAIPENNEEVEALELRVAALENETSILREVRSNLETEVSSSRTMIEDLTRRLQISDAMIRNQDCIHSGDKIVSVTSERCGNELTALQDHCEKIESSLRSLELQYSEATAKFRRESDEKDRRKEELERELEKLRNDAAEDRKNYSLNAEENVSLKKNISQLQSQLQNMDIQFDELQKEIEIRDRRISEAMHQANSDKEDYDSNKKELQLNCVRLMKYNDNLKNQIYSLVRKVFYELEDQTNIPDVSSTTNFLEQLESELRDRREYYSKLESDLRLIIKGQDSDLRSKQDLITEMKEELECKKILCQDLTLHINNLESQLVQIEGKNNKLQQDFKLEKELLLNELNLFKNITKEYEILKNTCAENEVEFKTQLLRKDEEINKYKLKLVENESLLEEKQLEIKNNLEEMSQLENQKTMEKKIREEMDKSQLQDKLVKLEEIIEETNKQMDEMAKENEIITLCNKELEMKYDELVNITNKEAAEAEKKINKSFEEVEVLKNDLEKAESQLNEAITNSKHGAQICESIKEEFLKKIDKERLAHEQQLEQICKEKSLLESCLLEETSELQKQLNYVREENNELKQTLQVKLSQTEEVLKNKNKEVESLKNQLEYVSQLLSVGDRQEAEGQPSADVNLSATMTICPNGCKETQEELSRLTGAVLKEQTENKLLKNQVEDLSEKVSKTTNQLNRLQAHLLSVEDYYISELQSAQTKLTEMQTKLAQADDRARNSSTAYTSANIRANQQVESLNQQLRLLTEHKEKLDVELSRAEDSVQRQNAAVTNLEAVLHQFQRDKQKDIDFETERLKQAFNTQCKKNDDLIHEIKYLQDQLNETKKGLAAANRLTEQLDQKSEIITTYKQQVEDLMRKINAEEEKVKAAYNNCEGKVDRNLMKNLLVGYVSSPHNSKLQVLNVLAQVLDLNKEERQKIGLENGSSIQQQSLSEAFIRFLESESQPKQQVYLPLNHQHSISAPPSRKISQSSNSSLLLSDELPNLPHFAVGRNAGSILKDVLKERNT